MHLIVSITRRLLTTVLIYVVLLSSIGFTVRISGQTTYPSIFILKEQEQGFLSLQDFKSFTTNDRQSTYLKKILLQAAEDLQVPYIDPTIDFEGRDPVHLKHANLSYDMATGIRDRLARSAFLFLYTQDEKYKQLVLRQIEALFDTNLFPMWCDKAHVNTLPHLDIRTCRISMWIALSYNWLHDYLSEEERQFIVAGLDRRAIQPFWQKLKEKPHWYVHRHNWFTNIFGGMGITAMALGDAHPDTEALLDTIVPAMIAFNDIFGSMGEFNEPPGYAGAARFSVEFAEAYRYYTKDATNLLAQEPFPDLCHWMMYHTIPPQRIMAFGDTPVDGAPRGAATIAAVANANNDGILQWYYLENFKEISSPMELFWFNPKIVPINPAGKLALGKEYKEYGASLISRSSWDQHAAAGVVYGKAGRETNHDDNDVGQLLIDGFGRRLIIDPGTPKPLYPADYFKDSTQYNYYSRSSKGHNVLVIGNKEMISEPNQTARGQTIYSWFNDSIGSSWAIDLTPVYDNAVKVTRKVIHLFPGIILVHDTADLPKKESIDLRWHTITRPTVSSSGDFHVQDQHVGITGKIISLNNNKLNISTGYQEYIAPYHLTRQGDPLVQDHEPYVKISLTGSSCSILTLFAVTDHPDETHLWVEKDGSWEIENDGNTYIVKNQKRGFLVYEKEHPELGIRVD